jgi:DNA invertase Pin-like site-specific DNA recombinase
VAIGLDGGGDRRRARPEEEAGRDTQPLAGGGAATPWGRALPAWLTDLAGSLAQFAALCRELKTHRVGLVCIDQDIDTVAEPEKTPNPASGLFYDFLAAILEFDRHRASEGTRNGLKVARARGSRLGRRPKINATLRRQILQLRHEGRSLRAIGREVALAPSTVLLSLRSHLVGERRAA